MTHCLGTNAGASCRRLAPPTRRSHVQLRGTTRTRCSSSPTTNSSSNSSSSAGGLLPNKVDGAVAFNANRLESIHIHTTGDVIINIGEDRGQPLDWDDVPIGSKAKALLQQHAVKPATALKLHKILGFEDIDDMQRLSSDLVSQLKLKPLQLEPLLNLLRDQQGSGTQHLDSTEHNTDPAAPRDPQLEVYEEANGKEQQREEPMDEEASDEVQQYQEIRLSIPETNGDRHGNGVQESELTLLPAHEPDALKEHHHLMSVAITPDGRFALSGSSDDSLRVYDLEAQACIDIMRGHTGRVRSVAISPDGRYAVSGSEDRTLCVWDLHTKSCIASLPGHANQVSCVAVTPDGRSVVSASVDGTLRIWTGQDLTSLTCAAVLEGHSAGVRSVAVTGDGRHAVSGSEDQTLRIFDLKERRCIATLSGHTEGVNALAIAPDGSKAVSGSDDHALRVWDLASLTCIATLEGHTDWIGAVAITPNSRYAVSGSDDHTLKVWDLTSLLCIATLEGHTDWIWSVAITPDGRHAVSASFDAKLRVWDLEARLGIL